MSSGSAQVANGIYAIDTHYVRPRMDASHLLLDQGRAAFVDTGTTLSVPHLSAALAQLDIDPAAVDHIILTHVHLDHAGGAGRLAALLPRAKVLVHPRGARHLAEPELLVAATRAVYGEDHFARAYGEVSPVPPERIVAVADGDEIMLGRRRLRFLHTPGHALHHVCILDPDTREIFSGDTFGVSYRELDTPAGEFIIAATTPSQFDPDQLIASIDRLLRERPAAVYLTHYSRVVDVERLGADLKADVAALVGIARASATMSERVAAMTARIFDHWSRRLDQHGFPADAARRHALLDGDAALNAAGLDAWLSRILR